MSISILFIIDSLKIYSEKCINEKYVNKYNRKIH